MAIRELRTKEDLDNFAIEYGIPGDWHEPDNAGINARIIGTHLDNAMGDTIKLENETYGEYNVVFTYEDEDVAVINLANLLRYATQ